MDARPEIRDAFRRIITCEGINENLAYAIGDNAPVRPISSSLRDRNHTDSEHHVLNACPKPQPFASSCPQCITETSPVRPGPWRTRPCFKNKIMTLR